MFIFSDYSFTKNADEAVTYYSRLDQNDFAVVCGLALAFYNSQQYTESMNGMFHSV